MSDAINEAGRDYAERRAAERSQERDATGAKWYIVQCIRGTDLQALTAFERFKIETYYPRIVQLKPLPRRRMSASQRASGMAVYAPHEMALFPRYVFVKLDVNDGSWHGAFDVAGVGGLVCRGGLPVFMPSARIDAIRKRESNGLIQGKDTARVIFGVGDKVFVTDGPLASFPGIVETGLDVPIETLDPSMRIKVAVNIFGRATPVNLEHWQVAKVDQ